MLRPAALLLALLVCGVQPFGGSAMRARPFAPRVSAHPAARAARVAVGGAPARVASGRRCDASMGIPKFFGWLCERYPLLKEHIRDGPSVIEREFDAFYLDMNGIIHTCTHGDDLAFGEQLDEEQMFRRILQYTDRLVSLVRPRKVLYLAIDGVAPRAKLNQQRSRRFRAALEKNADRDKLIEMGQLAADDTIFDSNCITPGTAFLNRLGEVFRRWIAYKVENDPHWAQGPVVIFSGADAPGEGEHKIMDFVRERKAADDYEPNQRHCFYGLDADLIMLGLVTHEPQVSLLRERPRFNRGQPQRSLWDGARLRMGADDFLCLDLSILRRSLALPKTVSMQLDFPAEERRLIDDFVLICMLVGNDFLPGLPHLDVAEGALNMMLNVYYRMLPGFGGYLTDGSTLHFGRFEAYLREICVYEEPHFKVRARKEPWMTDLPEYRHAYYRTKFGVDFEDVESRKEAVSDYMHGLQWCLRYYHDGCCSWTW
jgi:5'-3' exoribonuclease 1